MLLKLLAEPTHTTISTAPTTRSPRKGVCILTLAKRWRRWWRGSWQYVAGQRHRIRRSLASKWVTGNSGRKQFAVATTSAAATSAPRWGYTSASSAATTSTPTSDGWCHDAATTTRGKLFVARLTTFIRSQISSLLVLWKFRSTLVWNCQSKSVIV